MEWVAKCSWNDRPSRLEYSIWAEYTVNQVYAGRVEAVSARNELVRWMDSEMSLVNPQEEPEVYEAMDRFRTRVMEEMNRKFTDSRPVIQMELGQQVSAVQLAYRLYKDPARAAELWQRNPSSTPGLIGPSIEALAP